MKDAYIYSYTITFKNGGSEGLTDTSIGDLFAELGLRCEHFLQFSEFPFDVQVTRTRITDSKKHIDWSFCTGEIKL
jgi:hypothetical protein